MIVFLLALQIAGAAASAPIPTFIIIRDGATATSVPVTINAGEPSVRADALMKAMKGALVIGTNLHYTLVLPRVRLDLIDGIPFAKRDTLTIPLTRAPQVRGGQLYLPFQFVSEVIPRYGGGYSYDVAQGELRIFASMAQMNPTPNNPAPGNSVPINSPARLPASSTAVAKAPIPVVPESVRTPARPPRTAAVIKPRARKLVVLDAGHGGPDNGRTGPLGTRPWLVDKAVPRPV